MRCVHVGMEFVTVFSWLRCQQLPQHRSSATARALNPTQVTSTLAEFSPVNSRCASWQTTAYFFLGIK